MTEHLKPSDFNRKRLSDLTRELNAALADVALLDRLKAAPAEVARIRKECDAETKALDKNLAEEGKTEQDARRAALAATVRNIRVSVDYPNTNGKRDLIGARIALHCELPIWNTDARESVWEPTEFDDLRYLSNNVAMALVQDAGKLLPQIILDLVPGDPIAALNAYARAKDRGYVAG